MMRKPMSLILPGTLFVFVSALVCGAVPADNTKVLLGEWSGKVTGPQGGPPTGDVVVTFEKSGSVVSGKITVTAPGGAKYSGAISNVTLKNKIFSASVVFKLGETALETGVSGPLKGRTIAGDFSVMSKGQKMGDGTFSITKVSAAKPAR